MYDKFLVFVLIMILKYRFIEESAYVYMRVCMCVLFIYVCMAWVEVRGSKYVIASMDVHDSVCMYGCLQLTHLHHLYFL